MKKIGIIAGNRKFPLLVAESARKKGYNVVAIGIKGDTSLRLKFCADKVYWLTLADFSRMFDIFKKENIEQLLMAGQISPWRLFSKESYKDPFLKSLLDSLEDKRADTIFGRIADILKAKGFELMDSTLFLKEHMPSKGIMTNCQPSFDVWEDAYFGFDLAKKIAFLDIGQTVAVKSKAIVAVEALEGTDRLILRAGKVARGGIVVVKVSKPSQDMRFDVPVVGLNTVKNLIKAGGKCLAIEAGKTLFIDKAKSIRLAESKKLPIVSI